MTESPADIPPATPAAVAVVILNLDGREHLIDCLEAVLASEGLPRAGNVVLADNGSTDGSLELVRSRFPGVRTLEFGRNLGFAGGNDRAAGELASEWVLFLNNDTRIAPDALRLMCSCSGGRVVCVGARLVSWDGRRLDFDGGGCAFTGHGHALGYGRPVPLVPGPSRATLFASGAAMLVHRASFVGLGGFDPEYFFYYEDVDLGWRMWLAGYQVMHVQAAVVRHRHHGTAHRMPDAQSARLYERNALATVVKNYGDAILASALPAALGLAAHRAGAGLEVIASARPPSARPTTAGRVPGGQGRAPDLPLPGPEWDGWSALSRLDLDFESLAARRRGVQGLRRRDDEVPIGLMMSPLVPVPSSRNSWRALGVAIDAFGLREHFGPPGTPQAGSRARRGLAHLWAAYRLGGLAQLAARSRPRRIRRRTGDR